MRELHKYELDFVSGGIDQVIVTHSRDGGATGGSGVGLASISQNRGAGTSASIGGGGKKGQSVVVPLVQEQCVDKREQVCTTGNGITSFSFGLTGVSMTRNVPTCQTTTSSVCTSNRASSK